MDKLLQYLKTMSKPDRAAFCASCGTTEGYLRKAVSKGQQLGGDLCILLERESNGSVKCEDLRPDADWAFIRSTGAMPRPPPKRRPP